MLSLLDHFTKQTCHSKCPKSSQLDNINRCPVALKFCLDEYVFEGNCPASISPSIHLKDYLNAHQMTTSITPFISRLLYKTSTD